MSKAKTKARPRGSRMGRELISAIEVELAAMRGGDPQNVRVVEIPDEPGSYDADDVRALPPARCQPASFCSHIGRLNDPGPFLGTRQAVPQPVGAASAGRDCRQPRPLGDDRPEGLGLIRASSRDPSTSLSFLRRCC